MSFSYFMSACLFFLNPFGILTLSLTYFGEALETFVSIWTSKPYLPFGFNSNGIRFVAARTEVGIIAIIIATAIIALTG